MAKDEEEYNTLFESDDDILTFVRKTAGIKPTAIDYFIEFESGKGFNERQLGYIRELLKFISQNGKFERKDLLREELYFGDLFDSVAINSVIEDVEAKL